MKKTLVAIAVSGAAISSVSAFAADSSVDVYGNLQYAYSDSDENGAQLGDNGSTIGLTGETMVTEGTTAFFKYELEADADENNSDVSIGLDQAFVGVKGGFGKVQLGTFDSIYSDAVQDGLDQGEYVGIAGSATTAEGDTLAYFSPSFNGLELQASVQVKGKAETETQGNTATVKDGTALTLVAKYSVDALTVSAGYDDQGTTVNGNETYGLGVAYQVSPALSVNAKYEQQSDVDSRMGVGARFAYGLGDVYGSYQTIDPEAANQDSYDNYLVGVSYNVASNMYVYAEYGQQAATKDNEDTVTAIGTALSF
ncbi:porin [Maribrevibacterium harenarium]|uniref:Porin n=1 Tax=Maribrevibacterium harenarium TaxID=2589817 RepID=A0A501WWM4_9GAMM|nr:porin [Maribrevibacterium harenarium]TPE54113.1 porin [Maribrevibacterium harenarium]